jgi:hypothetical protein
VVLEVAAEGNSWIEAGNKHLASLLMLLQV